jgi:hypothetical protein
MRAYVLRTFYLLVHAYLLGQFRADNCFTRYALRKMTLTRLTLTLLLARTFVPSVRSVDISLAYPRSHPALRILCLTLSLR